jgi:hypothetical protein
MRQVLEPTMFVILAAMVPMVSRALSRESDVFSSRALPVRQSGQIPPLTLIHVQREGWAIEGKVVVMRDIFWKFTSDLSSA